jgi:hypothetical protein
MKPYRVVLPLLLAATAGAQAQPVTEAIDPAMVKGRDWLQQLDRGEFEQALAASDPRLAKRGVEKFSEDVTKSRRGVAMPSCRSGLHVEILKDGVAASFVARYGEDRVLERITLLYDKSDQLHPSEYKISGAVPKDSKACSS